MGNSYKDSFCDSSKEGCLQATAIIDGQRHEFFSGLQLNRTLLQKKRSDPIQTDSTADVLNRNHLLSEKVRSIVNLKYMGKKVHNFDHRYITYESLNRSSCIVKYDSEEKRKNLYLPNKN
ncbi:hypothetical protein KIN20_021925 [Parelaphostrongylus tenuis]|uniref:Uncharacterized protein n=1 Tax=Parelaphostrongylus tenuis TaxID=148309 RepID=A0AAD5N555_PARTN|nr:hypothetical protein KIN20_021925 [Parelaphostrongylus tenuis]